MYLQWDPDDYDGIKSLRIPTKFIWLPDTIILNMGCYKHYLCCLSSIFLTPSWAPTSNSDEH